MSVYDLPEYKAFLAAIREQPADDNVRRVCADWLDENGEPERGEFVRVQCELARVGLHHNHPTAVCDCDSPGCTLHRRAEDLAHANYSRWWPELPSLSMRYERGFIEALLGSLAQLRTHLPALLRREPVTRVDPEDRWPSEAGGYFAWLLGSAPELNRIPPGLFGRLGRRSYARGCKLFETRESASLALSDALISEALDATPAP